MEAGRLNGAELSNQFPLHQGFFSSLLSRFSSSLSSFIFSPLSTRLSSSLSTPLSSSLSSPLLSLSLSSFSLFFPCLRVLLWLLLCVVGVVSCVSCVLCLVLWCETLQNPRVWIQKRLRVSVQNVSVCSFKTSLCVTAPRAHVFQHVCVVPAYTGTF